MDNLPFHFSGLPPEFFSRFIIQTQLLALKTFEEQEQNPEEENTQPQKSHPNFSNQKSGCRLKGRLCNSIAPYNTYTWNGRGYSNKKKNWCNWQGKLKWIFFYGLKIATNVNKMCSSISTRIIKCTFRVVVYIWGIHKNKNEQSFCSIGCAIIEWPHLDNWA